MQYTYIYIHTSSSSIHTYIEMGWEVTHSGWSRGAYPYSCKWKGGGGGNHPTASDFRVRLQPPESCRLRVADSQGVGRLDSEVTVAWTSLSFGRSSSGSSRANLIESSRRSWPATIKAVQLEAAAVIQVQSESTAASASERWRGSQARVGMLSAVDKGPPLSKIIIGTGLAMTD